MPIQQISSVYGKIKYIVIVITDKRTRRRRLSILSNTHSNTSP